MPERRRMRLLWLLILGVAPILFVQAGSASSDHFWQIIDEGLETRSFQVEGPPYETLIKLRAIKVDLDKFQVRVIDSRSFGAGRMEIRTLVRKAQALAAVNGGFFLPDHRPLGLLIVDGKETNPLRKTDWGIFLIQNNRPRIIHTRDFQNEGTVSQALQVGPRLVVNGEETRLKRQAARRSAVGINSKGQVLLVSTEDTEVYAQDLARLFRLPESQGGLECRDALTLDGGPSAQMYGEYKSLKIDIPGGWPVPNGLGIFKPKP